MSSSTKNNVTVNVKEDRRIEYKRPSNNDSWAIVLFLFFFIPTLIFSFDGFIKVCLYGRPDGVKSVLKKINTKYSSNNNTYNIINNSNTFSSPNHNYEDNSINVKRLYYNDDDDNNDDDEAISFINLVFAIFIYQLNILLPLCVSIFYYFLILNGKVEFTTLVLSSAAHFIKNYIATIFVGYIASFFGSLWSFCVAFTIYGCILDFTLDDYKGLTGKINKSIDSNIISALLIGFVAFSYLYIKDVIKNIVHVTVSAVYGYIIFNSTKKKDGSIKIKDIRDPTYQSLKRAMTELFGSICYGSFIMLLLEWTRKLLNAINRILTMSFCICFFCCFEYAIESMNSLLEYFNSYAFVYVAFEGSSFRQAAKETYRLMHKHGIDAILNDTLVSRVMVIGKLTVIILSCFISYEITTVTASIDDTIDIMMHIVVAFTTSETIFSAVSSVLQSGVSTLFVGVCNEIKSLKITQPEFCNEIIKMKPNLMLNANENVSNNVDVVINNIHNELDDLV